MGCFGFICKGCGTAVRGDCFTGGEKCVMIHVRHGKEVGRVEGHYDEYGRVIEQKDMPESEKFRGNNDSINGHSEICDSEFRFPDSYEKVVEKKLYNGEVVDFNNYIHRLTRAEIPAHSRHWHTSYLYKYMDAEFRAEIDERLAKVSEDDEDEKLQINCDISCLGFDTLRWSQDTQLYKDFMALPNVKLEAYSGLAVWHSLCYHKATPEQKADLTPSLQDPNQSWGKVRKKYV